MKGVLTMKGSGCVRVTASGACATIGSLKDDPGAGQTLLSIRCNATVFVEKMFRPIMSSTNTALVATQSSAEASGDKGDPDRVRVTFVAAKPRNAIAPYCRQLAKSRPRSALPSRRGLEFMFEAQVKVYVKRLGSVSLADGRPCSACRARNLRTAPVNENRTVILASRRCGATRTGTVPMRSANGQQNAHRRDPSGGDPGGGFARQPRRGIRL
jgi:hypothetical protein